jgi:uncharacterized protein YacL
MIYVIRAIFLTLVSIVAAAYLFDAAGTAGTGMAVYSVMFSGVVLAFGVFLLDVVFKRKNLSTLSGLMFGVLVGVLISLCIGYLIDQVVNIFIIQQPTATVLGTTDVPASDVDTSGVPAVLTQPSTATKPSRKIAASGLEANAVWKLVQGLKLLIGLTVTYITVAFILQTKDDFRFIIPYVEFSRATKGPRPLIIDTSVIIDGRIVEVAATGVFESPLLVPRFVLNELQTIADSGDKLKRSRGRRGLEVLEKLKAMPKLELRFWDGTLTNSPESDGVDQKLVVLAQQENGRIMTNDFNLNKIAALRGITVININSIADALKPVVLPGETMKVRIVKPGEGPTQGVGYLEDGTMVVVEGARDKVGVEVELIVTNALQTAAGKMIFGRTDGGGHAPPGSGIGHVRGPRT